MAEIRAFAKAIGEIAKDEALLRRFVEILESEDAEAFNELITRLKLETFCHQLCHWLSSVRCRLVCHEMCPPTPLITEVGNIPVSQITAGGPGEGYAAGPSIPPGTTAADNKAAGVGDHPFGGLANIRGALFIANPFQYKVEYASLATGPWTAILQPIQDISPTPPYPTYPRVPDASGWYNVSDMGLLGPTYLTDWDTTPPKDSNKLYFLKLTVRNTALLEFESPVVPVKVDNVAPTMPIIGLQLLQPDGTLRDLGCCETVVRGNGNLVVITLTASDENFCSIGVNLSGGCGVTIGIVDTGGNPLSKTYNGILSDTGYPVPTPFLWDPWAAGVSPCCYQIGVGINDRAIVGNSWSGGHGNSNFRSITIA